MNYVLKGQELFEKVILSVKLLFIPFRANNFSPKFLVSNVLLYAVICLLIIKIISIAIFMNFPKNIFFADTTKSSLVNFVNRDRLSLGLLPLIENKKLDQAALLKAKDILEKDYFSHQSPEGTTPWYWFSKIGYNYKYAGENLAIGFLNSEDVYIAWVNSKSHKENIVNSNYQEVGTAVLIGEYKGNTTTVAVQLFGSPKIINRPIIKEVIEPVKNEPIMPVKEDQFIDEKPIELVEKEVLAQFIEAPLQKDNITYYKLLNFIFYNSDKIFEYVVYFLLILTGLALLLNILVSFNIQNRHLILKSFIIIILLFVTVLLNKGAVNQIITHEVII